MASRLISLLVLAVIACAAAAPGVFTLPVLDRDEALYIQASAQMAELAPGETPACLSEEAAARSPVPPRFIAICFGDEPRNKKPIGVYWAQSMSALQFSPDAAERAIWAHRLPSLLGAILAAWGVYAAGCSLIGRRGAFMGAALFSATILMGVEGGIARTDALLTGFTTLAIAALARLYITQPFYSQAGEIRQDPIVKFVGLGFWAAMACAVLIKGPVAPLVAGCAITALFILDRRIAWLSPLLWWPGIVLFLILVGPWYLMIIGLTEGEFLREALGRDLGAKLVAGQESHGAPPLSHALWALLLFFPATFVLLPGLVRTLRAVAHTALIRFWALSVVGLIVATLWWQTDLNPAVLTAIGLVAAILAYAVLRLFEATAGKSPPDQEAGGLQFLLAWSWLAWVVFELTPTKLPHYPLTLYPALALMAGGVLAAIQERRAGALTWTMTVISWSLFLVAGAVAAMVLVLLNTLNAETWTAYEGRPLADALAQALAQARATVEGLSIPQQAAAGAALATIVLAPPLLLAFRAVRPVVFVLVAAGVGWHVLALQVILPKQTHLFASEQISLALAGQSLHPVNSPLAKSPVAVLGYTEPSLHVRTHGEVIVFSPNARDPQDVLAKARGAAEVAAEEANRAAVIDQRYDEAFLRALAELGAVAVPAGESITAFNYSTGEEVTLLIYRTNRASPARVAR